MKVKDLKIISDYQEGEVIERNSIIKGDCLEVMKGIKDKSIDVILCDLPYGTTACKWDEIIPFEPLWEQYKRIIKDNGAIVLFASQPFTSKLIMSNIKEYRYQWVWDKVNSGSFVTAKYKPLSIIEDILVFGKDKKKINYYPIMELALEQNKRPRNKIYIRKEDNSNGMSSGLFKHSESHDENLRYPKNKLTYNKSTNELNNLKRLHPTQKPIALLEYLIKTYTLEGELILDNTAGSMSTAIASINTNRDFIMIEKDDKYFEIGAERIKNHLLNKIEI